MASLIVLMPLRIGFLLIAEADYSGFIGIKGIAKEVVVGGRSLLVSPEQVKKAGWQALITHS